MKNWKHLSKRGLAMILTLMMCLGMLNLSAFAAEDSHVHNEDGWTCEWTDPVTEPDCQHEHDESCYIPGEPVLVCEEDHEHIEDCYVPGEDVLDCQHVCGEECVTVVTEGYWTCTAPVVEETPDEETPAEVEETPDEVQAFLNAVDKIPVDINADNAAEVAELVYGEVSDAYEALLGTEYEDRDDVQEAVAVYAAAIDAVDAALNMESSTYASSISKSAFSEAYNLNQGDTCRGIVSLDGNAISDSGTPNVWATGMWGGSQNVTGYNWVHIINTNPDVATVSYTTDGGKLTITFTPGSATGVTHISVGVDAKYPHDQLGTWNMELNFDYTVTNSTGGNVSGGISYESSTYDYFEINLTTGNWTRGKSYGATDAGSGNFITDDPPFIGYFYSRNTNYGITYPQRMLGVNVTNTNESVVGIDSMELRYGSATDYFGGTQQGYMFSFEGLQAGTATMTAVTTYKIASSSSRSETARYTHTFVFKVTGERTTNTYELIYDANGGAVGTGESAVTKWSEQKNSAESSVDFTVASTVPTREGYTFKGWADGSDAESAKYQAGATITLTKTASSKTIYAVWENAPDTTYTVKYVDGMNGVSFGAVTKGELAEGDKTPTWAELSGKPADAEPTLDGYTFMGWAPTVNHVVKAADADENGVITYTATWQATPTIDKLEVTKTPSEEYPVVGEAFTYTIEVNNSNSADATVTVTDTLNEKLTFVSASDGGQYNEVTRTVTWTGVQVPGNSSKSLVLTVKANTAGDIDNEATVALDGKTASGNTTVTAQPNTPPTPDAPEAPSAQDVRNLIGSTVKVVCVPNRHEPVTTFGYTGDNANRITIGTVQGNATDGYTCQVTFLAQSFCDAYSNLKNETHTLVEGEGNKTVTLSWNAENEVWELAGSVETPITFHVECEIPAPTAQEVNRLLRDSSDLATKSAVVVYCEPERHQIGYFDCYNETSDHTGRIEIGTVVRGSDGVYTCEVTFLAAKYAEAYSSLKGVDHTVVAGERNKTVTFQWNTETKKWAPANGVTGPVVFYVECAEPDLTITKTADKTNVTVGETVTYTIVVKNTGDVKAENVVITDKLDSKLEWQSATVNDEDVESQPTDGKYNIGTVAAGKTVTLVIIAKAVEAGNISNNASVTTSKNDSTAGTEIDKPVDVTANKFSIRVTKQRTGNETVDHDSTVNYTVNVTNTSTASLWDLVIDDTMDPGLTLVNPENVTAKIGNQVVTLNYIKAETNNDGKTVYSWEMPGEFKVGDTVTLTYSATVSNEGNGQITLENVAHGKAYTSAAEDSDAPAARSGRMAMNVARSVSGSDSDVGGRAFVEDFSNENVTGGGENGGDKPGSSVTVNPKPAPTPDTPDLPTPEYLHGKLKVQVICTTGEEDMTYAINNDGNNDNNKWYTLSAVQYDKDSDVYTCVLTLNNLNTHWAAQLGSENHVLNEAETERDGILSTTLQWNPETEQWDVAEGQPDTLRVYAEETFLVTVNYKHESGSNYWFNTYRLKVGESYNHSLDENGTAIPAAGPNAKSPKSFTISSSGNTYTYDEILTTDTLTGVMGQEDVTVNVYYSLDVKGTIDTDSEGNPTDTSDGIPDKYQAKVVYVAGAGGTQTGVDTYATIMNNGKMATEGIISIAGATATPNAGNHFVNWTAAANGHDGWTYEASTDATLAKNESVSAKGGAVYTFTANFEADAPSTPLEVSAEGVTATYDGQPHPVVPTTNKEGAEIEVVYKDADGNEINGQPVDAGEYTAEITATLGSETDTVTVTVTINKRALTVTTDSASKAYNGTALTAPGRVSGLVEDETVTFVVTGTQTAVGSSTNTYTLTWDGTAKESNYEVTSTLGTLTVYDNDDGDDPYVPPTPPTGGDDNDDPVPPTGGDDNDDPTPPTGGDIQIEDEDPPLAEQPDDLTNIEDAEPPLADLPDDLTNIEDEEPPLADLPKDDEELTDLEDERVPLDGTPKTGDNSRTALWAALSLVSLGGMIALFPRKKREEQE